LARRRLFGWKVRLLTVVVLQSSHVVQQRPQATAGVVSMSARARPILRVQEVRACRPTITSPPRCGQHTMTQQTRASFQSTDLRHHKQTVARGSVRDTPTKVLALGNHLWQGQESC
jgi:hypothetical protein